MERIAEMNKIQNQDISESNAKLTNNYQSFLHQLNQEHILPDLYHNVQQPLMSADLMKDSFNAASSIHIYNKNPPTYIEHQSQSNVISNNSQNDALMVINSNQSLNKLQPDSVTLNVNSETLSTSNLEEEAFNDKLIWCEDCGTSKNTDCPDHPSIVIRDAKPISLARQTLPSHFSIGSTADHKAAVICNKRIKKCTRFGPFIAPKLSADQIDKAQQEKYTFKVFKSRHTFEYLDTTDENVCNWMMFIRLASTLFEQNLIAYQHNGNIYFSSISNIDVGEELRVGLSESYALLMGVKTLKQSSATLPPLEKKVIFKDGFPCDTCDLVFSDFESFDAHNCPNEALKTGSGMKGGRTRNKRKGKPQKLGSLPKTKITAGDKNRKKSASRKMPVRRYQKDTAEQVKCQECDSSFNSRRRLDIHMHVHTGEYPYKCHITECFKNFNTKFKLDRHLLTHGSRDFTCTHCGKAFVRKDNLNAHLVVHDSSRQLFKCTYNHCKKQYTSKVSYNVHTALHKVEEEGSLECSLCHKLFDSSVTVTQHIKVHAGSYKSRGIMEKKYKCTTCEKRFFALKDRDRHLLTHTKEKNFECNICFMKFARSDHLKRHHVKIHPDGQRTVKSSRGRNSKTEQLSELTASEFTRSIQQLLVETNLMEGSSSSLPLANAPDLGSSSTTVQITPLLNTRTSGHNDPVGFTPVQSLAQGQRNSINSFLNNIATSSSNLSSSQKPQVSWQHGTVDSSSRYVISGDPMTPQGDGTLPRYYLTGDSIRLPIQPDNTVTTYLLPQDTNAASASVNLDSLNRHSSMMMDSSQALPSDSLSNDYTADGLKVLAGLTPIFLNSDGTTNDTDLIPIVYQTNQH